MSQREPLWIWYEKQGEKDVKDESIKKTQKDAKKGGK